LPFKIFYLEIHSIYFSEIQCKITNGVQGAAANININMQSTYPTAFGSHTTSTLLLNQNT
ncbi:hypothetical protein ACR8FF_22255, partial [Salmonella enterica subsp. enterica serovar Paratyphi A]